MDNPKLQPLAQFTPTKTLTPGYGDHYIFFVGRDDVHGIMHYLLSSEDLEHDFNMYSYDDPVLNQDIMNQLKNPNMLVQGTLDKSQASGVHEKQILEADETNDPNFLNDIAIGESATHQISHTKAGVCVGLALAYEGSVNWSAAGEGVDRFDVEVRLCNLRALAVPNPSDCLGIVFVFVELCTIWSAGGVVEASFTLEEAVTVATIGIDTGAVVWADSSVGTAGAGAEVATDA